MIHAIILVGCMILNRVRGGGFGAENLPGHPRFYVAPVVGLLAWAVVPGWPALTFAASYLWWSLLPWGNWFDLGRLTDGWQGRRRNGFEEFIDAITDHNDHLAFALRNAIGFAPLLLVANPVLVIFAPILQVLAYEAGWRANESAPIETGELLTGALWGALILSAI